MDYDEYEVIPTSPIRNLEKRVSRVETTSSSSEVRRLIEQIIELIKSNQRIIDDIIKSNSELRNEMSRVPGKIDELLSSMHEFMELLKTSATEETVSDISKDVMDPLVSKMGELVDQNKKILEVNQASLSSLGILDKRLKRIYLQFASGTQTQSPSRYSRRLPQE
ncbi:MAG: hypothetical protein ABIJ92_03465 [Candidatus Aenigmatarchaeota archaeon]